MNFESYLISQGYNDYYLNPKTKIKEPFKYYSTIGHLWRRFEKKNIIICYGLYEHGLPPYLISLEKHIKTINLNIDDYLSEGKIIQRIEQLFNNDVIEEVLISGGCFEYNYLTDSIKLK